MKNIRKCVSCGEYKDRNEMIKVTREYKTGNIILNPDTSTFGRSAYLCYNQICIKEALKKNKLNKALHTNANLKGLLDGQFEGK